MLTDKAIRAIRPDGTVREIADYGGLSMRVSAEGHIAFQYRYRFRGSPRRLRLGQYPETSLAQARDNHAEARRLLNQGMDPVAERRKAIRAGTADATVEELVDEYIKGYCAHHHKHGEAARVLKAYVTPKLGQVLAKDLTRGQIVSCLDPILARGKKAQANRTLSVIKQMLNYSVERDRIPFNPALPLKRRNVGGIEKSRDRALSMDEVVTVWTGLESAGMSLAIALALKLLLLTGQRRGELTRARKADFDLDGEKTWTIPAEHAKNGRAHMVHLAPAAVVMVRALMDLAKDSHLLFPSPTDPTKPVTPRALSRAVARSQGALGLPHWTPHDLRRTAATRMVQLGTRPEVVERVLNHTLGGVAGIYNRHDYLEERREALNAWATAVLRAVDRHGEKKQQDHTRSSTEAA